MDIKEEKFIESHNKLKCVVKDTPLQFNERLSLKYNCNIFLKREDLQKVRSFKIRGAFSKIISLTHKEREKGIVCASAGNHAQGVALSCSKLSINGDIFIPSNTPLQKINRIRHFSQGYCKLHLYGTSFNECLEEAEKYCKENDKKFIHPYNDIDTIIGQGTMAVEIYNSIKPDIIISSVGGGGLISGISLYSKKKNTDCLIYGVEPDSCPSMKKSIEAGKIVELKVDDHFVDGATVSRVGDIPFSICRKLLDRIYECDMGKLCGTMLDLYQEDGIISEPAGALPIAVLDQIEDIEGKNVVCILSGGNNDITKYSEIMDRYLRYKGLKYYYIIKFSQKPGELKRFINNILGPDDDIIRFEYIKKTNMTFGNVLVGIQLIRKEDVKTIDNNLVKYGFKYIKVNDNDLLYSYII